MFKLRALTNAPQGYFFHLIINLKANLFYYDKIMALCSQVLHSWSNGTTHYDALSTSCAFSKVLDVKLNTQVHFSLS